MKKVALLLPAMRMGGAEKICLNFLEELTEVCEVTLILNKKEGELLSQVPPSVKIIEDSLNSFKDIVARDIRGLRIFRLIQDLVYYLKIKIGKDSERNYGYLVGRTPPLQKEFDYAIGYVANVSTQIFCLADRIYAKKKIAWIHGETTELKDTNFWKGYFCKFSHIFTVSQVTREHFVKRFPMCASITDVYYNPINRAIILDKAKEQIEDIVFENKYINLVTVGRLSPEKGCDMIPEIVKSLMDKGHSVRWYIIGDGSERDAIEKKVYEYNAEKNVFILGNKINPYPYIKGCDFYIQPSYEEGYSTTICEAGILGKAIIGTTTSGGIREQIRHGVSGMIVKPQPEEIAECISDLINTPEKRRKLEYNVGKIEFSHKNEIKKIMRIIDL